VSSLGFTFVGYWLFYESDTQHLFGIQNTTPLVYDGIYRKKELYNLPVDPYRSWTTIVFQRNYGVHPEIVGVNSYAVSNKRQGIIKLFRTTDATKDYFRFQINGNFILSALSTIKTTQQVPCYNDTYVQSGVTYVPVENHSLKNIDYFATAKVPVDYKIRLTLTNPFECSERQNYEI
jgi:hypothetical protein